MENMKNTKPVKPKGIRIEVSENGVLTADMHIPYFVFKMGMRFGKMANGAKRKGSAEDELERLRDVDMDAVFEALNSGEMSLPCLLAEAYEPDKNQHVKITLE